MNNFTALIGQSSSIPANSFVHDPSNSQLIYCVWLNAVLSLYILLLFWYCTFVSQTINSDQFNPYFCIRLFQLKTKHYIVNHLRQTALVILAIYSSYRYTRKIWLIFLKLPCQPPTHKIETKALTHYYCFHERQSMT